VFFFNILSIICISINLSSSLALDHFEHACCIAFVLLMSDILHAAEVRACQQPARASKYALARAMTRERRNEQGRQTRYIQTRRRGWRTNQYGDNAKVRGREDERKEEGENSVASRWNEGRKERNI